MALMLVLVGLWSLTHRYGGLEGDAKLYAVQALAKIHPNLASDLYLRNTSQDSYTVFSGFYAKCIALFGLRGAALTLTIAFKLLFFLAAWTLIRQLANSYAAILAVALLIITPGAYGAYGVFHYAEDWLTARSLTEALVATAVALSYRGFRALPLLIACAAMLVHPLMALPGLLLLVCIWSPFRLNVIGAGLGILVSLGIEIFALRHPSDGQFFSIMDANWLEVVRERSQFLFLQLWRAADWKQTALPFLSLAVTASAVEDPRIRKLCAAASLVGATGLLVALTASCVGPVSIMLQGQAWRWVWPTEFISVLLLPSTLLRLRHDPRCGLLCNVLMISAWTASTIDGATCIGCALVLWSIRDRIAARTATILRWAAVALAVGIAVWAVRISLKPVQLRAFESVAQLLTKNMRETFGLFIFLIVASLAYWIRSSRSLLVLSAICGALLTVSVFMLPKALRYRQMDGNAAEIEEFSDWRGVIPPNANVFVMPTRDAAPFAWFTLERPSYLSVDQSSGVVFSAEAAFEVRRRSQVLLPLMDPDWRLLSKMKGPHNDGGKAIAATRPLTREVLIDLCADAELNFIVARENVGFDPIRHTHPGSWKDWNLYDCGRLRYAPPHG